MNFLHTWPIYAGIAAAALPVVVHWLTRPRPVRFPISTLRFVLEVVHQRRARNRLRDFIILALRTAAVLLLAWAVARPLIGQRALVDRGAAGDAVRIVILDVSQSMAAGDRGIDGFERARARAAEYLTYRPGLRANLIQAGAAARGVFEGPSANLGALHAELAQCRVRPEGLNLSAAVVAASEQLAAAAGEDLRRELVVISDFQRSNWTNADFSPLPADTLIELESVAPADTPANLAILRVGCQGRPALGQEVRLEVEVGNFSATNRPVEVEVALGDAAYRLKGVCPAQGKVTLSDEIALRSAGWQLGEARLIDVDDALAADNSRAFVVDVRPPAVFALVTRQPRGGVSASSFYLELALAPLARRAEDRQARVVRIDPGQLDDERVAGAELIVLDHPGKLAADATRRLANLLRRGRAILYFASEVADANNLRQLADAAGTNLRMPVEFAPPQAGHVRHDLVLTDINAKEQPFVVFGDELGAAIGSLRFAGGLASQRLDEANSGEVLAAYSDQSAALVVTPSGAGLLSVWNVDLEKSNLAGSPAFVPLLGELVERLLGQSRGRARFLSGEPLTTYLSPDAGTRAELTLSGPEGAPLGELADESLGVLWRAPATGPPGIYQVRRGDATVFALASEISPAESDLASLDPATLKERLAGARTVHFHGSDANSQERDDWWTWLAVACVACMLTELAALRSYRV